MWQNSFQTIYNRFQQLLVYSDNLIVEVTIRVVVNIVSRQCLENGRPILDHFHLLRAQLHALDSSVVQSWLRSNFTQYLAVTSNADSLARNIVVENKGIVDGVQGRLPSTWFVAICSLQHSTVPHGA